VISDHNYEQLAEHSDLEDNAEETIVDMEDDNGLEDESDTE